VTLKKVGFDAYKYRAVKTTEAQGGRVIVIFVALPSQIHTLRISIVILFCGMVECLSL
jgi:hypothetical protein